MNARQSKRVLLTLTVTVVLILAALKPLPAPKARAQRIHAVNHWANITITLPSTNTIFYPSK